MHTRKAFSSYPAVFYNTTQCFTQFHRKKYFLKLALNDTKSLTITSTRLHVPTDKRFAK